MVVFYADQGPPLNFAGEALSPHSIQLSWSPLNSPNNIDVGAPSSGLESYELYYSDIESQHNVHTTLSSVTQSSYLLEELIPNTVYYIRLSAKSAASLEGGGGGLSVEGLSTPVIQVRTLDSS